MFAKSRGIRAHVCTHGLLVITRYYAQLDIKLIFKLYSITLEYGIPLYSIPFVRETVNDIAR